MNFVQIGVYDKGAVGHIIDLVTTAKVRVSEPDGGQIELMIGGIEVTLFIGKDCLIRPDDSFSLVTVNQFTEED